MRVLVVGGSGFIGQSIVAHLRDQGHEVGIYSRNPAWLEEEGYAVFSGDLLTDNDLTQALQAYQAVIYLVTVTAPQTSMQDYSDVYEKEIPMFIKLLDACVQCKIKRVIFASSGGTVYGDNENSNDETRDCWPICHYAIGKLTCEKILYLYNRIHHMQNVSLRISNPYGIGQREESGVGAITVFSQRIVNGQEIALYGDGNTERDYIRVDYVAEAFCRALEWEFDDAYSPAFNIGSGKSISLNRAIQIISDAIQQKAKVSNLPERAYDVRSNHLDIQKAVLSLGYLPPVDPEADIAAYAAYIKEKATNNHG